MYIYTRLYMVDTHIYHTHIWSALVTTYILPSIIHYICRFSSYVHFKKFFVGSGMTPQRGTLEYAMLHGTRTLQV